MTPALRIGDADRERASAQLGEHFAAGRLDSEEYAERLDACWTARTAADLAVLFHDLPALAPAARPVARTMPSRLPGPLRAALLVLLRAVALVLVIAVVAAVVLDKLPWWAIVIGVVVLLKTRRRSTRGCRA